MSQLSFTFHYPASEATRQLADGNRWLMDRQHRQLTWSTYVQGTEAYLLYAAEKPLKVTLAWSPV